jgi:hypothetical protein
LIYEYGYSHEKCSTEDLADFIGKVEERIGLTDRSLFYRCASSKNDDLPTISWIEVLPWWKKQQMRHQFFTCCLRAVSSMPYRREKGNFDKAIKHNYLGDTSYAVTRFLSGYTWYTGIVVGWVSGFSDTAEYDIDRLLVKPRIK